MCTPNKTVKVVMFGLNNAGKTTIVGRFNKARKSPIRVSPNVQHFDWGPLRVTSLDVGSGQPYKSYVFNGCKAVIFVLDSSDYQRFEEAQVHFWKNVDKRLRRVPVLMMANKCDSPGALLPQQISEKMNLECLSTLWHVVQTNAINGDGVCEGLTWIRCNCKPKKETCIQKLSHFLKKGKRPQPQNC